MTSSPESKRANFERLALAGVVVLAVALYAPVLGGSFTLDDHQTVLRHPGVAGPFSLREVFLRDFWGNPFRAPNSMGSWRPLTTLTYALNRHLFGGASWGFHVVDVLLYAGLIVALERFLRAWAPETSRAARLAIVIAFAALGIHADAVASVTGRAETLAALTAIGAASCALRPEPGVAEAAGVAVATTASLLCKESAFAWPLFVAVIALRRVRTNARRAAIVAAAVVPVIAVLAYRLPRIALATDDPTMRTANMLIGEPAHLRIVGAVQALAHYVEHAIAALELAPDYGYAGIQPSQRIDARFAAGLAIVVGLAAIAVALRRRAPAVTEAVVGFVAAYAVVSHVLFPSRQFVADRNFFFPSFWLVAAIVIAVDATAPKRTESRVRLLLVVLGSVLVVGQCAVTVLLARVWRSHRTLSSYCVQARPTVELCRRLRVDTGYFDHDPELSAWSELVAQAILARFPTPIAEDDYPPEWEELPFAERVARLRAREGQHFGELRDRARRNLHARGLADAERVLATL